MKIIFTGAHGTGKTTLVKLLARHPEFKKFKIFDGVGRYIHGKKKKWSDKRKQHYFDWYYVRKHYFTKNFIASRGLYDTFAYSRVMVDPWYHWWLFNWGFKHIYYDHVFYLPVEFDIEDDGLRYDEVLQEVINSDIQLILDFYHVPYHTIEGTVEERYASICKILGLEPIVSEDEKLWRAQETKIRSIQVRMSEEGGEGYTTIEGKVEE